MKSKIKREKETGERVRDGCERDVRERKEEQGEGARERERESGRDKDIAVIVSHNAPLHKCLM